MQFVHTPYFPNGYAAGANGAQQQQQQQHSQHNSPHQSPAPNTVTAAATAQSQPLAGLPAGLHAFVAQATPMSSEMNAMGKPKRKQVKNACVNCQKACKKCDDGRPCQRCVKYGLQDTCTNSVRKERKKGIKRGPYKKRSKDESTTPPASANVSGGPALASGLYGTTATSQGVAVSAAGGVRGPNGAVLAYPTFQSSTYEPFQAAGVSYPMAHQYMVPAAAIQQMYPANTMLSYQAAMNMLSPQHGQSSPNLYAGYRPQTAADGHQQVHQQQQQDQHQQEASEHQQQSHEGSPATSAGVSTPTGVSKADNSGDSDDEGSKLNILSQLCSAVLDRTPDTKQDNSMKQETQAGLQPGTATPSGNGSAPHSREASSDSNTNATSKA